MANPITAIASRSCAKNSMLKQVGKTEDKDDLSKGSSTTQVSTTVDVPIASSSGSDIYGTQTDTTVNTPGTEGTSETKKRLSYKEAWDQDVEGIRTSGMYKDYKSYVGDREGQRKKDPVAFEEGMFQATGVSGGPGEVTVTTPGTPGDSDTTPEVTPDYESAEGMTTFDIRKDFRRQKIAERLAGKSDKQARRFAKRAARLEKRGKTEKAKIFEDKSTASAQRAANLKDRLSQFKTQQDQGSFGSRNYETVKVRQGLEDKKKQLEASNNPNTFTGSEPTDFQRLGKGLVKTAESVGAGIGDLTKPLGDVVKDVLSGAKKAGPLKKNYFNK